MKSLVKNFVNIFVSTLEFFEYDLKNTSCSKIVFAKSNIAILKVKEIIGLKIISNDKS